MNSPDRQRTFTLLTLGCKVNQYDSEAIARRLRGFGWRQVPFGEPADACVVDTCTVTAVADRKSRKAVHRATRARGDMVVAVTGCGPTWNSQAFAEIEGVTLIIGNEGKERLAERIVALVEGEATGDEGTDPSPAKAEADRSPAVEQRVRAFLKVQDGCNRQCTYCIVPRVRGRETSRPLSEVVSEGRARIAEGYRELVVTGVRLGGYRDPTNGNVRALASLLQELNKLEGLRRIRLSSLDPPDLTPGVIRVLASADKVCEHVHLALQSGDDEVLRTMRRGYRVETFLTAVRALRERVPQAALTTDVLVGFPGETEEQFQNTLEVCREAEFSRLHVFRFSPRPGTPAATMPRQVSAKEKKRRSQELRAVGKELAVRFARRFLGRSVEVLVERHNPGTGEAEGLTREYVRTWFRTAGCRPGEVRAVRVHGVTAEGELEGEEESGSPGSR